MRQSFFEEFNKKELELVKAGEASVNATIQELAASGHGFVIFGKVLSGTHIEGKPYLVI